MRLERRLQEPDADRRHDDARCGQQHAGDPQDLQQASCWQANKFQTACLQSASGISMFREHRDSGFRISVITTCYTKIFDLVSASEEPRRYNMAACEAASPTVLLLRRPLSAQSSYHHVRLTSYVLYRMP